MSQLIKCDICSATTTEDYATGWVNIQHLGYVVSTYGEQAIEHMCGSCWNQLQKLSNDAHSRWKATDAKH